MPDTSSSCSLARKFERAALSLATLFAASTASAENARCPKWEPGTRYPWQSNTILRGDRYAWLILDVDRKGNPIRCRVANDNYPDGEARVWLCKQYLDLWRGPRAAATDPKVRRLMRYSLVPSYEHHMADQKARRAWFQQNPGERPQCYPEPSRADRLDL